MLNKLKNKKVLILLVLFLVSISSVVYLALQTKKPSVTPPPDLETQTQLKILNYYPNQERQPMPSTEIAVSFTFNLPVSLENLSVLITPSVDKSLSLSKDQKILYIQPLTPWKYDTRYQIIVQGLPIEAELSFIPISPSQIQEVFDENPR